MDLMAAEKKAVSGAGGPGGDGSLVKLKELEQNLNMEVAKIKKLVGESQRAVAELEDVSQPKAAELGSNSAEAITIDSTIDVGMRIEAEYQGDWYDGVVVKMPSEDKYGQGRYTVQCDADAEGTYVYASLVRLPTNKVFEIGSRIEAEYEGVWYGGVVLKLPSDDKYGQGRYTVQCDADPEGTYVYPSLVRLPQAASGGKLTTNSQPANKLVSKYKRGQAGTMNSI